MSDNKDSTRKFTDYIIIYHLFVDHHCADYVLALLLVQVRLRTSSTHPKFDPTEVSTHNLQIMSAHFHVTEMLALTTWPSATSIEHL